MIWLWERAHCSLFPYFSSMLICPLWTDSRRWAGSRSCSRSIESDCILHSAYLSTIRTEAENLWAFCVHLSASSLSSSGIDSLTSLETMSSLSSISRNRCRWKSWVRYWSWSIFCEAWYQYTDIQLINIMTKITICCPILRITIY